MRKIYCLTIVFLAIAFLSPAIAGENPYGYAKEINSRQDSFTELTQLTYKAFKDQNEYSLITYYEDYCNFCFVDVFEHSHLSKNLAEHDPPIKLGALALSKNWDVGEKHEQTALPILILYHYEEEVARFPFSMDVNYLEKWAKRNTQERFKKLSRANLQSLVTATERDVTGEETVSCVFIGDESQRDAYDVISLIASQEVTCDFYIVSDQRCAKEYGTTYPGFMMVKTFDQTVVPYKGSILQIHNIQKFIVETSIKNVFNLGPEDNTPIFSYEIPYMILFIDKEKSAHELLRDQYAKAGANLGTQIKFAVADFSDPYHSLIAEACGIQENLPQVIIFHSKGNSYDRYSYNQNFGVPGGQDFSTKLEEFITKFKNEELQRYYVTEKKDKDKPFQLTGGWLKNFLEQKDKLRVIMYYSSKDVNSQGILIDFEEIAEFFEGPQVAFGHIDVSKNDISPVLGYEAGTTTNLGKKKVEIMLVTEENVKEKLIMDYEMIPYQGPLDDPRQMRSYIKHFIGEYKNGKLEDHHFNVIEDL